MICHWIKDPDTGVNLFIPNCYGALHDPDGCTCEIEGSRLEKAAAALARAEEQISYMRDTLNSEYRHARYLERNNNRLRDEIRRLKPAEAAA